MKSVVMTAGAAGIVVLLAGCGPELAQIENGEKEARWQEAIRANYSGYKAPRTAPPGIADNVSPRLLEEEELQRGNADGSGVPAAADDLPEREVDNAAQGTAPVVTVTETETITVEQAVPETPAENPAETSEKAAGPAATPESGETYVVAPGDTLGGIARKFYGDARRYDVIVRANPALSGNPNLLRVGMKLVIPKI